VRRFSLRASKLMWFLGAGASDEDRERDAECVPGGAARFERTFTLAALARRTLDINAIVAAQGLSAARAVRNRRRREFREEATRVR
jgi:hypothetical protein